MATLAILIVLGIAVVVVCYDPHYNEDQEDSDRWRHYDE